jgi:thiol-disulfide isomerase/thioredoxin
MSRVVVAVLCILWPLRQATGSDETTLPPRDASLVVQLVRDPTVQTELALRPDQAKSVAALVAEVEYPLFQLRDVPAGEKRQERESLATRVETALRGLLERPQSERLAEILVRAQGFVALLGPPHSETLGLTDAQTNKIRELLAAAQKAKGGTSAAAVDKQVLAVLTSEQLDRLSQLTGSPFDLSRVRTVACPAPELRDVEGWINSDPLTFEELKGRVVVVHFWAFSCVNCVHDLPHYKNWHEQFAHRGLTVLALHTPETQAERSFDSLARQVAARGIAYPVAAEVKNANWSAWANHLWPSVYLVDRQGYVRYWWYGELNWQGAEGEAQMRKRIEQLLVEKK